MTSIIETIKAKVDVVEEIGLVVALRKSGKSFKGSCPFHNERTPSFYVFAETQTWRCFGCNEGGDVFTFVQKQQGLEFHEALLYLAEKAGVAVEEYGGRHPEEEREASAAKERLRTLNEHALLWFHQALLRSKEAIAARMYVQSRGISTDSVISFSLGYAPDRWDSLSGYLLGQGYTERELVIGGLARERDEARERAGSDGNGSGGGGVYDYFRNRLIFPIRDMRGRVIGFGGRALGDDKPKYLNSPQTLLFEKSSVLYAIDMARDAIKQAGQVVIVEGYVDAVIAHQYGTKQTVACIGSAITEKHIQQLKKLTKQVTLALDPDAAGSAATEHGIQEALKAFDRTLVPVPLATERAERHGAQQQPRVLIRLEEQVDAEINVLQLPEGEDPDEVIRRDFSTWFYAVSHPLPLIDYYFGVKTSSLNLKEPHGKTEAAKRLLPVIGMMRDRIKRDAYLRKLASMISVDERILHEELQRILRNQNARTATFSAPTASIPVGTDVARPLHLSQGNDIEGRRDGRAASIPTDPQRIENQPGFALDKGRSDKLQWEDYLIGLLLRNPGLHVRIYGIIDDGDFAGTDTRELYRVLNSLYQRGSSPSHQPLEQYIPSALLETVTRVQRSVESKLPKDEIGQIKAAVQCATRLKRNRLVQLNTELQYLIGEATGDGDRTIVRQLQQRLRAIHQQLHTIDSATHLQG